MCEVALPGKWSSNMCFCTGRGYSWIAPWSPSTMIAQVKNDHALICMFDSLGCLLGRPMTWGFPKIRGTLLRVPLIRIRNIGVYIGVPLFRETATFTGPRMAGFMACHQILRTMPRKNGCFKVVVQSLGSSCYLCLNGYELRTKYRLGVTYRGLYGWLSKL